MIEIIPSARRLIRSLRDVGYEFVDAVADIVDNSIEAQANHISINIQFEGEDSYVVILDNGFGMSQKDMEEALRFGSQRSYNTDNDLGRYGLGLKTASLSQCESLTVPSRRSEQRRRICSLRWDLEHISKTNRWEVLQIHNAELKDEVIEHLENTVGTAITWERLGRLMGYKYPSGEKARRHAELMAESLKQHLGLTFHHFLSGEIPHKRISIYVNGEKVAPWDPYSRGEFHTQKLELISIPIEYGSGVFDVTLQPYILPPQAQYSSLKAHLHASGPLKWNRQQGFYIYRAGRIIQAGGWSGLRTSDEHTKLVRIAFHIPPQLDELFQVNVAKKYLSIPRELRSALVKEIAPIIQRGQETYRGKQTTENKALATGQSESDNQPPDGIEHKPATIEIQKVHSPLETPKFLETRLIGRLAQRVGLKNQEQKLAQAIGLIVESCAEGDRAFLLNILERYAESETSRATP